MNILLIEDHDFQRQVLAAQLAHLIDPNQDHIYCATNGIEALEAVARYQPQLLFCDLNMPQMDGISFLGHLAEQQFTGAIIITSALNADVVLNVNKMCKSYGLNLLGTLAKPIHLEQLKQLLIQAINQHPLCNIPTPLQLTLTEQDIIDAFNANYLTPYYQPIVNLKTGDWVASEALIRFIHPSYGIVPASCFIQHLTQIGKDSHLALLIINHIISHQAIFEGRRVAVNISAKTLVERNFINHVLALHNQYPQLHHWLYFELTESDLFESAGKALEAAARLGMRGFNLSIDDFGTGYSSLKQLDILPFKSLKLDISFVQAMPTNYTAKVIIETCLLLAHRLNLTAIAEGVEDITLWLKLQKMDCELAQGYFISPPLPSSQIPIWHAQWLQRSQQLLNNLISKEIAVKTQ
ncbi:EAL domain-containing response regulator [uncultured Photobacterium sp.]|uniref:EAL domain-containing response regulator n=1 Tax=uncultured Photobacterium sp. TaxID=173973 RepID=UPI002602E518|nr:EAL domain-containing response regulator [uncultured Photobacterium sp.]